MYDILLFPDIEEFMDSPAIDVFLALQDRGESLVPELCVWLAIRIFSNKSNKLIIWQIS